MTDDFVTCGGGPPGDPNGEIAQLHADLRDFLQHVIDMSKGDHYWDVVRGNAAALLRREALTRTVKQSLTVAPVSARCEGCAELRDQLRDKCAWIEELEQDAERYRFVRTADKVGISAEAARDPVAYDDAIDRAMEREKSEQ